MKKMLVLCVMAAFLAVGCGGEKKDGEKKDEAKKEEEKKEEGKKDEAKPEEGKKDEARPEQKDEAKPEEKPETLTGPALWTKSCDHATKLILASGPPMRGIPEEAKAGMAEELPTECYAAFKRTGGAAADESAICMLALKEFSPEGFGNCEPKGEVEEAGKDGEEK